MSIYTPVVQKLPKARPLAMALIEAASEQGANMEEFETACSLALQAVSVAANELVPVISHFKSNAEAALDRI